MKKTLSFFPLFLLLFSTTAYSQLQVVSTIPENGSANVSTGLNISITFNEPLDTTMDIHDGDFIISNNMEFDGPAGGCHFSSDYKTITFSEPTQGNIDYEFLLYGFRSQNGDTLATPYLYRFTTESAFSGATISGQVTACNPNVSVANILVALFESPKDGPDISYMTLTDDAGNYSLPYVKNGAYAVLGVIDAGNDGVIEPDEGNDLLSRFESIEVQGANLQNVDLFFPCMKHYNFPQIVSIMDSIGNAEIDNFSNYTLLCAESHMGKELTFIKTWDFKYLNSSDFSDCKVISYNLMNGFAEVNSDYCDITTSTIPIGDSVVNAFSPDSLLAFAEANGGAEFRQLPIPNGYEMKIKVQLGQLSHFRYDVPDSNGFYWGVKYIIQNDYWEIAKEKEFIFNYRTGELLRATGLHDNEVTLPQRFSLSQNYPNPVSKGTGNNSFTTINYSVAAIANGKESSQHIQINVYDILGRKVATLVNKTLSPGKYSVNFNTADLPSGIYFYRLQAAHFSISKKMIILK